MSHCALEATLNPVRFQFTPQTRKFSLSNRQNSVEQFTRL